MTKRILLVDDDTHFRNITLSALADRGHTIIQAASCAEARTELNAGRYDLLIIDGQLPDGDGIALIEEVRKKDAAVAIAFVSAFWRDTESYHLLTRKLHVNVVMHKPVIPAVFMEHIDRLLGFGKLGPVQTSSKSSAREKLARLAQAYGEQLPASINEIASTITHGRALLAGADYIVDASRKAHMLRGTAATCGFPGVSTAMAAVEDRLRQMIDGVLPVPEDTAWSEIDAALALAREDAKATMLRSSRVEIYSDEPNAAQVLAITGDEAITAQMTTFGHTKEISLAICDAATALRKCHVSRFDVIFCQIETRTAVDTLRILQEIRKSNLNVHTPIILIAERLGPSYDAERLYVGCATTLFRPLDLNQVNEAFGAVMEQRRKTSVRVMLVDDDVNFIKRAELLLIGEEQQVQSFDDTARVLDILPGINPDVLFLDVDISGISGFDVCRKLRETEAWKDLPVVFVTAQTGWETRRAAFECGGDDYLAKPIVNAELILKSSTWVERGKARRHSQHLDPLTGLPTHSSFAQEAQAALAAATTDSAPFTLALIAIEELDIINASSGPAVGDIYLSGVAQYLKAHFPPACLRGRWSGNRFVIAFPDMTLSAVQAAVNLFAHEQNAPCRLRVGCASSEDGRKSLYVLAADAESMLKRPLAKAL